jgi:hypothetical protein
VANHLGVERSVSSKGTVIQTHKPIFPVEGDRSSWRKPTTFGRALTEATLYQIAFRSGAKKHLSDTECTTFRG